MFHTSRHLSRLALVMAALLAFLTVAAGALHHHSTSTDPARLECRACAWAHSASASVHVAVPFSFTLTAVPAPPLAERTIHAQLQSTPHSGRSPPVSSL